MRSVAAQVGLVLVVLCIGLVGGSMLVTGPSSASPPQEAAMADAEPGQGVPAAGRRDAQPVPDLNREEWTNDPTPTGSPYAPVSGSIAFGDAIAPAEMPRQEPKLEAPSDPVVAAPARGESSSSSTSVVANDSVPIAPTAPAPTRLRTEDEVASLGPVRAGEAVLFAVSFGDETVLFDVGVPGAGVLPPSIRGSWAWVGTCSEIRVEISQLPGAPPGTVRGVGTSTRGDRFGWVVPRAGCRLASRQIPPSGSSSRPPDADPPREVQELRSLGELPCAAGRACLWFVGLDGRGRAVALLMSGGGHRWIRLGPGAGVRR